MHVSSDDNIWWWVLGLRAYCTKFPLKLILTAVDLSNLARDGGKRGLKRVQLSPYFLQPCCFGKWWIWYSCRYNVQVFVKDLFIVIGCLVGPPTSSVLIFLAAISVWSERRKRRRRRRRKFAGTRRGTRLWLSSRKRWKGRFWSPVNARGSETWRENIMLTWLQLFYICSSCLLIRNWRGSIFSRIGCLVFGQFCGFSRCVILRPKRWNQLELALHVHAFVAYWNCPKNLHS